jgi:amino acid adenylation domain-containing protein
MTQINPVSTEERERILYRFNDTMCDFSDDKTLFQLFREQVDKTPNAPALIFKGQLLNYNQMHHKVCQLALYLKAKGVGPGTIVAIIAERSFQMMIGLFGILAAGGAYLPIDPHNPINRIRLVLKDSAAPLLLTLGNIKEKLELGHELEENLDIINLDDPGVFEQQVDTFEYEGHALDVAYVIYTSGSTGLPKGVMIQHQSVVNRLQWMQKKYPIGPGDVLMQKTPIVFDVSVWELFWWSLEGAALCLMLPGFERFPQAIVETVATGRVTVMHFVPSMMSVFLQYIENSHDEERLATLKRVFVSGEALKPPHVTQFSNSLYKYNNTQLVNLYGPTEATVDVSYYHCLNHAENKAIPIGKPIDNIRLYIVDEQLQLCPIGVEGELTIAGIGLARGYLNRPQLTDKKFVAAPFMESETIYKTGDIARWLPDGNIEFLGRIDHQVKIRGLRIELGEIETLLSAHPAAADCAVIVKETSATIVNIIAFLAVNEEITPKQLKEFLKPQLPDYMIPSEYKILDALPLTRNGKVDRKALKELANIKS